MANKIFVFVGPFASGKSTIVAQLKSMGVPYLPVYTTKVYKESEKHKAMLFNTVQRSEFIDNKDFLIKNAYKGSYFGLLKSDVINALEHNSISVTILDPNGAKQIAKLIKKKLSTIYLLTDYVALVDRMLRMGLRNDEIKYHLEYAEVNKEFDSYKFANHVVKNTGKLNTAMEQILAIMGLMTILDQEDFNNMVRQDANESVNIKGLTND